MEKVLLFHFDHKKLDQIYKICSSMKVMVIPVSEKEMLVPLKDLLNKKAYRGSVDHTEQALTSENAFATESLIVMCDLTEKHVDHLLAAIRLSGVAIDYKAVLTKVNAQWNGMRMLAEMAAEKRAFANKKNS